jgi:hypothetical protein
LIHPQILDLNQNREMIGHFTHTMIRNHSGPRPDIRRIVPNAVQVQ